jgi:hypothetical protein
MKKLIGIAAFVTIGLFWYTHEVPSVQADNATLSSPMANSEIAVQAPSELGCPFTRPHCCEPDGNGGCLLCIANNQQCP